MNYGAVIVAAGMSTRMNEFKQLMMIGNKTLAERVVVNLQNAGVKEIVMVVGYRSKEIRRALSKYKLTFIENPDYETTQMFDSAKLGFDYIKDRCDKTFFCPADVPFFNQSTIKAEMELTKEKLIYPVTNDKIGHPILIDNVLIPLIFKYRGDRGLKGALDSIMIEPYRLDAKDEGSIIDADTKDIYDSLVEMYDAKLLHPVVHLSFASSTVFITPMTIQLIRQIDITGNVRDACMRCGISYSKGWQLIHDAEKGLGYKIADRQAGGANGGFSTITPRAHKLVMLTEELEKSINKKAQEKYHELFDGTHVLGESNE